MEYSIHGVILIVRRLIVTIHLSLGMAKNLEILRRFGKRVQELRLKKGITSQMGLALKSKLDRTYIGGVERGERNISLINIEKIAKALDITLDDLLKF